MNMRRILAILMTLGLILTGITGFAENTTDTQKLDAAYTLALNAIQQEDYETAKTYLDICFVYCDVNVDPEMYADLLVKRACIHVIEEKYDMALLSLDAALDLYDEAVKLEMKATELLQAIDVTSVPSGNAGANGEKEQA